MQSFSNFNQDQEIKQAILKLAFVVENHDLLTENTEILEEGLGDFLNKFGLKIHKGDGIIDYIAKFSKGAGKLLIAAIKGNKEEVKKIATSLDKAQVVDFLLKLDMATMHLVTGPIHMIDAVTGWDLAANLKHAAEKGKGILDKIKKIYNELKTTAKNAFSKNPEKIKAIEDLEQVIIY